MQRFFLGVAATIGAFLLTSGLRAADAARVRAPLAALYRSIGGSRACTYLPQPNVRVHRFSDETAITNDGQFIVEHFYNRGISELSTIGFDVVHHRFVRVELSKDGSADIAVSLGPSAGAWSWSSLTGPVVTKITPHSDGSYGFSATNAPGSGRCGPPLR